MIKHRQEKMLCTEMSEYLDLEMYDLHERVHPYYQEMIAEMLEQVKKYTRTSPSRILEIGSGTGIVTEQLIKIPSLEIDAIDIDKNCCAFLTKKLTNLKKRGTVNVINGDAVTFCNKNSYDLMLSSFSHDHISYDRGHVFAKNIAKNLTAGGVYIMGVEVVPYFRTEYELLQALFKYHGHIITEALLKGYVTFAPLELTALKSGLLNIGDFKRHCVQLEEEMKNGGLSVIFKRKIGPLNRDDLGGVYVFVFKKVNL